jgi:AraC-like DNA-binding protein
MILSEIFNESRNSIDLTVYHCGKEECEPLHSYGPAVRDHFLVHYVLEGLGTFYVDGKAYTVKKNQGFLICPNVITYYEADKQKPWTYTWVGFYGFRSEYYLKAANISRANPIFSCSHDSTAAQHIIEMLRCCKSTISNEVRLKGLLCLFLSELMGESSEKPLKEEKQKEIYIKKSIEYIEKNFSRNISINDMSKFIGLNRNYLSTLFKAILNISPQEFLIDYRMKKAEELLSNPELSISNIAFSVGYEDPLAFSKIFKKVKGCSPRKYRVK